MAEPRGIRKQAAGVTSLPFCADRWTDTEIVRGLIYRDPRAGRALFDKYHSHVNRRVRRLLGPDAECSDQVQQVFTQLVAHITTLRDPEMLARWLNRIIINTVRKELRRRKRRWFLLYTGEAPEMGEDGPQENAAVFRRAIRILDEMKPEERVAFVLRFVICEDVADIAEMCDWSVSTAKRRIAQSKINFMRRAGKDPLLCAYGETLRNG
jgi:RNA polymerase sigma factor (sigma-70 family)